ncbi:DNA-binding protein [Streptococcus sp. X16XC17]|uniref:SatD family protein n=1 Tax=unclassified Streptococcus TaxID=2608887 RepID=UPI00066FCFC0|nr:MULTISPECIES: SatD family protein [unclassified Streptococcus]TCD46368.1 DNA-binding protein [Streptococcus sp. X16XC17]
MAYFAIIGDFVDSKSIKERYHVQKLLEKCLEDINHKYKDALVSKFSITLGDEFQGLFEIGAPLFHIIDDVIQILSPYTVRFGIGLGDIVTDINPELSIGADGPAYWHAREAIQFVHQKNDYGNTSIAIKVGDATKTSQLNALIAAGDAIKADWRASQQEVFSTMLSMNIYDESFDQQALGHALQLNASALSKRLKSSSIKVYLRLRQATLDLILDSMKEEQA